MPGRGNIRGKNWLLTAEMEEGDLAMLILRTADHLRHIRTLTRAFPETARTAALAVDLILREPVLTDYLA